VVACPVVACPVVACPVVACQPGAAPCQQRTIGHGADGSSRSTGGDQNFNFFSVVK